jgi:hypothetical protein
MFYNLLPEEIQKKLLQEYHLRFSALLLILFSTICVVGVILLIPSYFLLFQKRSGFQLEIASLRSDQEDSSRQSSATAFRNLEEKMKALNILDSNRELPHVLFEKIVEDRGASISIQRFSSRLVGSTTEITVEGVAKTRDDLIAFKDRIKKKEPFTFVEFPPELLAKSKDMHFLMNIK